MLCFSFKTQGGALVGNIKMGNIKMGSLVGNINSPRLAGRSFHTICVDAASGNNDVRHTFTSCNVVILIIIIFIFIIILVIIIIFFIK